MRRSRLVYPKSSIMRRRDGRRGGSADMTRRREGWHAQAAAAQVAAQSGRQLAACGTCLEGARRRRRSALAPPSPSLLLPAPPSSLSRQDRGRLPHGRRCHRRRPYGRLSRRCSVETPSPRSPSVLLRGLGVTVARFRPTHAALEASRAEPRGRWRPMGPSSSGGCAAATGATLV